MMQMGKRDKKGCESGGSQADPNNIFSPGPDAIGNAFEIVSDPGVFPRVLAGMNTFPAITLDGRPGSDMMAALAANAAALPDWEVVDYQVHLMAWLDAVPDCETRAYMYHLLTFNADGYTRAPALRILSEVYPVFGAWRALQMQDDPHPDVAEAVREVARSVDMTTGVNHESRPLGFRGGDAPPTINPKFLNVIELTDLAAFGEGTEARITAIDLLAILDTNFAKYTLAVCTNVADGAVRLAALRKLKELHPHFAKSIAPSLRVDPDPAVRGLARLLS